MPRKTFPRSQDHHRLISGEVLAKHARATGCDIALPVPIEQIIEATYGLEIVWEVLDEPPDSTILGALVPSEKRILINERHADMFERWIGPERFTLAHELAHWVYDADDPDQLALDLEATSQPQFCYHRESPKLSDDLRVREVNANKLAAHLLLPENLVRRANTDQVLDNFRQTAAAWGVSQQTLRIRLQDLGLIDDSDVARLDGLW